MKDLKNDIKKRIDNVLTSNLPNDLTYSKAGLVPKDWKVRSLGEISIGKGNYGANAGSVEYSQTLPTYLRITDIDDRGRLSRFSLTSVDIPDSENYRIKEGDLIFIRTGSTTGKSYLYRVDDGNLVYAGFLIKFSLNCKLVVPEFIWQCTYTNYYNYWVHIMSTRSGQPGINSQEYSKLNLPIPGLDEQHRIAEILSTWDKSIGLKEKLIEEKKKQKSGLMQKLLSGKVRLPGFDMEWEYKKADLIFENISDKKHGGIGEVLSASQENGILPRTEIGIDIKFDKNSLSTYKRVRKGDFVISLRSFQGGIETSDYEGLISPAYTVLRNKLDIGQDFYKNLFKSINFITKLNGLIYGIRDGKQIGFKDFSVLELPYPELREQEAIGSFIELAEKEIKLHEKELEALKQQKKGLIQLLLTGIVRVDLDTN